MARLYASGAAIGMSPIDVKRCSIWEFAAAVNGHAAGQGRSPNRLGETEADALFDWLDGDNDNDLPLPAWRYAASFGSRGFWLDGIRVNAVREQAGADRS